MYRWKLKDQPPKDSVSELSKQLNISPILSSILTQRGYHNFEKAKTFFRPNLKMLHDPFLMKDMDKAVERIQIALEENQKILIYGDYDVDGTTAVSLLYGFLKPHYENVAYYIPNRYSEGYGISTVGIDYAADNNYNLIIALDCGIKANDKVDYASLKGVDFIICDHHTPGDSIPEAIAVLDPKRNDCNYPFKELTGCGIGFKLLTGLCQKGIFDNKELLKNLDLVAISTCCDIVPIVGENRVLVQAGIQQINQLSRAGLREMLSIIKEKREVSVSDLVFIVGPRINAAGRIDEGRNAVQLLTASKPNQVSEFHNLLETQNTERKELDKTITKEALSQISTNEKYLKASSHVLYDESWHKGVIGIVASRVIEKFYKPTIILTKSNGIATGSARSVKGFDLYQAIEKCSDEIIQFGGHKYAAGLTLEIDTIDSFRNKFDQVVSESISEESKHPEIEIDAELNLDDISDSFFNIIEQMAPFGPQNSKPIFVTRNLHFGPQTRLVGSDLAHLKFEVFSQKNPKQSVKGIGFNFGEKYTSELQNKEIDIAYQLSKNEWQGKVTIEMSVKDIRLSQ